MPASLRGSAARRPGERNRAPSIHRRFKRLVHNRGLRRTQHMFRKLALSLAVAGLISQFALPAEAALGVGAFAPPASLVESSPVEKAQFVWGGRRYCWYNSAWRGPGWYQCGFAWRRGSGWGGAAGWHGWRHPGFVHRPVHRPPVHRPPVHRPPAHRPPVHRPPGHRPGHGASRPGHQRPPAHRPGGGNRGGSQRR